MEKKINILAQLSKKEKLKIEHIVLNLVMNRGLTRLDDQLKKAKKVKNKNIVLDLKDAETLVRNMADLRKYILSLPVKAEVLIANSILEAEKFKDKII